MSLDLSQLVNVKRLPDGSLTAGCPLCMAEGHDKSRSHLWVHKSGAFRCAKVGSDKDHNLGIRKQLGAEDGFRGYEYFDYVPKLTVDKVFPEDTLDKLLPDYTYWINRGVNPKVFSKFKCGVAAEDEKGKLSGRFVHPIRNIRDQLIGFAGRLMIENSFAPKWKILGKKKHFIYPEKNVSCLKQPKSVILVEGIGDVLALAGIDIYNTLCLFGLEISGDQIAYLVSQNVESIIIATNNEASAIGNEAAVKLKSKLRIFFNEDNIKIHLPPAKDFLDCSVEQLQSWKSSL